MTGRAILAWACTMVIGCSAEIGTVGSAGPTPSPPPTGSGTPGIENPTPPAPLPPSHAGFVYVHTFEYQEAEKTSFGIYGDAWFGVPPPAGTPLSGCELIGDRSDEEDPPPAEPEPVSDNAGTIDVAVTLGIEQSDFQSAFDKKTKLYEMFTADSEGPATGTIRFRAPGGAVPAFSVDLVSQAPAKILAPVFGSKVGAGDLPITFTVDPDADFAFVSVGSFEKEVRCLATKGTTEVVVPAALMSEVMGDERTTSLGLSIYAGKSRQVDVGDYRVRVQHSSSMHLLVLKE